MRAPSGKSCTSIVSSANVSGGALWLADSDLYVKQSERDAVDSLASGEKFPRKPTQTGDYYSSCRTCSCLALRRRQYTRLISLIGIPRITKMNH